MIKTFYTTMVAIAMMFGVRQVAHAETYKAWGSITFMYRSTPMYDADETLEVTDESITFSSATWGEGTFDAATGEGALSMDNHRGGVSEYAATIAGSVEAGYVINLPSVMGGTTIAVTIGEIPASAAVADSYTGGTYANAAYFKKYQPAANQTVTITANAGYETASVSHVSETWGTFTYEAVTVTQNTDGSFSLTGEGTCAMPSMRDGSITNYASDFSATITDGTLVASFSVPAVMGGTTLLFNPADIDEVVAIRNVVSDGDDADAPAYNLSGVRVDGSFKGVVIRNGRKYLQK